MYCSRSQSAERRRDHTPDVDISLEAGGRGSSLATTTIPDLEDHASLASSSFNKTGSDILLPPLLPESRSLAHMRKLKSLDKVQRAISWVYFTLRTLKYEFFWVKTYLCLIEKSYTRK